MQRGSSTSKIRSEDREALPLESVESKTSTNSNHAASSSSKGVNNRPTNSSPKVPSPKGNHRQFDSFVKNKTKEEIARTLTGMHFIMSSCKAHEEEAKSKLRERETQLKQLELKCSELLVINENGCFLRIIYTNVNITNIFC